MKPIASILLFTVHGIPVFAHATLLLGLAVVSQLSFRPLAWLGLIVVILIHEMGHAILLRLYRQPVQHIVLHGFGGECVYAGRASPWERAVVAWGGVLAQMALVVAILLAAALRLWPRAFAESDFYFAITVWNIAIAAFNLLPVRGLDGSEAWGILRLTYFRMKKLWLQRRLSRLKDEAADRSRFLH